MPQAGLLLCGSTPCSRSCPWGGGFLSPSSQTNLHPKPRVSGPCLTRQAFGRDWVCKEEASAQEGPWAPPSSRRRGNR